MQSRIKILHLEDLSSDAELIGRELRKENLDFERLVVDTKEKFIKALKEFSPDIILSDHSLPSFNSYEALSIFHNTGMKIPFILITSNMSDEFAVDILKRGADDYILKDRLTRLPTAIHHTLEKYRLEKEKQDSLEELVRNEKRYHALVENSTEGIIIHNIDGKPKYVSASVKKILGYTLEELREMDPFSILHEEDKPFMEEVVQQVLATPGIHIKGHTGRMLNKDGTYRWVEATVTNMLHDPAIMGIVDNFRDVTENKIAEQQLIYSNRLYTFISQINQTIVHTKNENELYEKVCHIATEFGKFKATVGTGWAYNIEASDYYTVRIDSNSYSASKYVNYYDDYRIPFIAQLDYPLSKIINIQTRVRYNVSRQYGNSYSAGLAFAIKL